MAITQIIRCYNPADFKLLLERTGLKLDLTEVNGTPFVFRCSDGTSDHPLWQAWSYLAKLSPDA